MANKKESAKSDKGPADESAAERVVLKTVDAIRGVVTTTGTAVWEKVFSALQSKKGRRPRHGHRDALRRLIDQFVRDHPKGTPQSSAKHLLQYLDALPHGENATVQTVTDTHIEWVDDKGKDQTNPISGLGDRLTQAYKDFANEDSDLTG